MTFYRPPATCQIPGLGELYEQFFGRRMTGTFVEVGAFDGETYSNTSCLADVGWRGLMLEPVQENAVACAVRHLGNPGVRVLPCAAGDADGDIDLFVRGALSTARADVAHLHDRLPWAAEHRPEGWRSVPCRRLGPLLERDVFPLDFDLLVVDVEGGEAAVFDGLDLAAWRPRAMIVELHAGNQEHAEFAVESTALRARLVGAGYGVAHEDEINTVFLRR